VTAVDNYQQTPRWGVGKKQWRASRFCLPPASRPRPGALHGRGRSPQTPRGGKPPPVAAERPPRHPPPPANQEGGAVPDPAFGDFSIRVGGVEAVGNPCCPPEGPRSGRRSLRATARVVHGRNAGGGAPPFDPAGALNGAMTRFLAAGMPIPCLWCFCGSWSVLGGLCWGASAEWVRLLLRINFHKEAQNFRRLSVRRLSHRVRLHSVCRCLAVFVL